MRREPTCLTPTLTRCKMPALAFLRSGVSHKYDWLRWSTVNPIPSNMLLVRLGSAQHTNNFARKRSSSPLDPPPTIRRAGRTVRCRNTALLHWCCGHMVNRRSHDALHALREFNFPVESEPAPKIPTEPTRPPLVLRTRKRELSRADRNLRCNFTARLATLMHLSPGVVNSIRNRNSSSSLSTTDSPEQIGGAGQEYGF
ncbi:hypothetical protein TcYC6_0106300 [Trypanosoma cruzi]|nr:hypothetical protein TcYC6_0106300 [Trypanosoma cruzi]